MRSERGQQLRSRGNGARILLAITAAAVLGGLSVWSILEVFTPPSDPLAADASVYAEAKEGQVESTLSMSASAHWDSQFIGTNQMSGIVTTVDVGVGASVDQGSTLYSVGLSPVVIARGTVPSFRSISLGSKGGDVLQLQTLLQDMGFYGGFADGEVGPLTVTAVKKWQKAKDVEETGSVQAGDIIYFPELPARVSFDPSLLKTGAPLTGGEGIIQGLADVPIFSMNVTDGQAALIASGTRVIMRASTGSEWVAYTARQERLESGGGVVIHLDGENGAPPCGEECSAIPPAGDTQLSTRVMITESVSGVVVPTAALRTTPTGETFVVDERGDSLSVDVPASARGMSIVSGLAAGTKVRLADSEDESE